MKIANSHSKNLAEAVIIAGGLGTRMKEISFEIPKCLLPLGSGTILDAQLDFFHRYKFKIIHLFLGHGAQAVIEHLSTRNDLTFIFHIESQPRGSAGELISTLSGFSNNLVVVHGDLYLDFPLDKMLIDLEDPNIAFVQLVHPSNHMRDSDIVIVDEILNIKKIQIKPHSQNLFVRNMCNAGVYCFSKTWLERIMQVGRKIDTPLIDIDRDFIPKLLQSGLKGKAHQNIGYVRDLGTPARFHEFNSMQHKSLNHQKPIVFIDRDGVINENNGWIKNISDFHIFDDVGESIKALNEYGYRVIVITNQPIIARGEATIDDIHYLHAFLDMHLAEIGAFVDSYFVCPHHPDKGFEGEILELKLDCKCRKPKIGLFEEAISIFPTDLSLCWMVGDTWRDQEAAKNMDIRYININRQELVSRKNLEFCGLKEAVNYIISF